MQSINCTAGNLLCTARLRLSGLILPRSPSGKGEKNTSNPTLSEGPLDCGRRAGLETAGWAGADVLGHLPTEAQDRG